MTMTPEQFEDHKRKCDEYFGVELVKGPIFVDQCKHGSESYVCSFISRSIHAGKLIEQSVDLYVFRNHTAGQEICLRVGEEPQDYASPGSVTEFICQNYRRSKPHLYSDAEQLLRYFGRLQWTERTP